MLPTIKMMTMINTTPSTPSTMTKSSSVSSEKSGTLQLASQSTQEQPLTSSSSSLFGLVPENLEFLVNFLAKFVIILFGIIA